MAEEKTAREKNAETQALRKKRQAERELQQTQARLDRYAGLTNKNEDYMYKLDKALDEMHYDPAKKDEVIGTMMTELQEKQKQGITAVKLYGPVSQKADEIVNGPKKKEVKRGNGVNQTFLEAALDNGTMMFTLFCLMFALIGLFSKKEAQAASSGWLTVVLISVITGVTMAVFTTSLSKYNTKGWVKITTALATLVVMWLFMFIIISLVPQSINPPLPGIVYFILATVGYFVRFFVKKKFNFRPNIF